METIWTSSAGIIQFWQDHIYPRRPDIVRYRPNLGIHSSNQFRWAHHPWLIRMDFSYRSSFPIIGYYPMINAPITILCEVQSGMIYWCWTGVYHQYIQLRWLHESLSHNLESHIILIGTFHCCGAYLKCLGSGWTEVALVEKLLTTGSMSSKGRIGIGL